MFLFILNLVICGAMLMVAVMGSVQNKRGTNTVSRFLRDTGTHYYNTIIFMVSGGMLIIDIIFLLLGKSIITKISFILPVITIAFVLYLMNKSTKSEQRKKDARVVTKGTLQVTSAVGETAGTAIGAAAGNPMAGKAIGSAVGAVAGSAAKNMAEEGIDTTELRSIAQNPETVEALIKRADRIGIKTEGRTPEQIAANVLRFASPEQLAALPDNLSDTEKAVKLLGQEE